MNTPDLLARIRALPLWQGEISATPLTGGITNVNYLVDDGRLERVLDDDGVWRFAAD